MARPEETPTPRRLRARVPGAQSGRWRPSLRRGLQLALGATLVAAAAFLFYRVDQFLASDSHFRLSLANLHVEGAVHVSPQALLHVFADDIGRSVYLMPLAARRTALKRIDWVKDASIMRRWPNRVFVRIVERSPVAFAVLSGEPLTLIDSEGVILTWPGRAQLGLPVLRGISRQQPLPFRRQRVEQVLELIRQVQAYAGRISEIDASDPENLVVTQTAGGRVVRLLMGNRNYLARMKNFLSNYAEIARRLPAARVFDLRLDDRITVRPDGEGAVNGR